MLRLIRYSSDLLNPLVHGISRGESGSSAPSDHAAGAVGHVTIGNVVAVQNHMLVKFDEKCINDLLSLQYASSEDIQQCMQ